MEIVSVSLDEKLLERVDDIKREQGFTGRSEVIRTALRNHIRERKEMDQQEGNISGVILISIDNHDQKEVEEIQHKFNEVITTQLHHHMKEQKCTEVLMVDGSAEEVKKLYKDLEASKEVKQAKIVLP